MSEIKFTYDISFFGPDGAEQGEDNFTASVPISAGDCILWHTCELEVDKVVHFAHGQNPSLHCKIMNGDKS